MLQQTQVSRVIERFEPFMDRFGTPLLLAQADEEAVLAMWQGLGYYRRARNLQRSAADIVDRFGGEVPLEVEDLMSLPGVGRYTAGSIASIVGGQRVPIVDGNITRLLARVYEDDAAQDDRAFIARTWERSEQLVQACGTPGVLNEGMMELGATVCTPASPSCNACPVRTCCAACDSNRTGEIPPPKRRAVKEVLHHHAVVVERRGRMLMQRRPGGGLWGGLWQATAVESPSRLAQQEVAESCGLPLESLALVESVQRQLTHRTVHLHVHIGVLKRGARLPEADHRRWMLADEVIKAPLSNAARHVLEVAKAALALS